MCLHNRRTHDIKECVDNLSHNVDACRSKLFRKCLLNVKKSHWDLPASHLLRCSVPPHYSPLLNILQLLLQTDRRHPYSTNIETAVRQHHKGKDRTRPYFLLDCPLCVSPSLVSEGDISFRKGTGRHRRHFITIAFCFSDLQFFIHDVYWFNYSYRFSSIFFYSVLCFTQYINHHFFYLLVHFVFIDAFS